MLPSRVFLCWFTLCFSVCFSLCVFLFFCVVFLCFFVFQCKFLVFFCVFLKDPPPLRAGPPSTGPPKMSLLFSSLPPRISFSLLCLGGLQATSTPTPRQRHNPSPDPATLKPFFCLKKQIKNNSKLKTRTKTKLKTMNQKRNKNVQILKTTEKYNPRGGTETGLRVCGGEGGRGRRVFLGVSVWGGWVGE